MENKNFNHISRRIFLRIGQINASGSKIVVDEIRKAMTEQRLDLLLLQEPYCCEQRISGFGLKIKTVEDSGRVPWTRINKIQAGIIVGNTRLTVTKLQQFSNTHFTCVQISTATDEVYLVSAYCQFCDNIEPYMEHLNKIIVALRGRKIIIGMDANANSPLWNSEYLDFKGEELETLVLQHNLTILNEANQPPTFQNIHGKSNIDVTLATLGCAQNIKNWRVREGWLTCGDHNMITFELAMGAPGITSKITSRFLITKADWNIFDNVLKDNVQSRALDLENRDSIDSAVLDLEGSIIGACNIAIPRKRYYTRSVPWWTPELTLLRKEVNKARKRYQKCRNEMAKNRFREAHRQIRRKYQNCMYKAKQTSWKDFVTKVSHKDPWSLIYKLQTDKIKIGTVINTIECDGSSTEGWRDSRELLLNALVPDDTSETDTEWQKNLRHSVGVPPDTEDDSPFSYAEICSAAKRSKNRKAPGIDNIDPEVAKRVVHTAGTSITDIFNGCLRLGVFPERWKQGVVRALLKGRDKDPRFIKSYRPICLLPVLSKVLERVMIERLDNVFNHKDLCSGRQFGFKRERSTEDAIVTLREIVDSATEKYVLAILFDISGAFDNVWWPLVLDNLRRRNCPRNLYLLMQDYLSNRNVKIIESAGEVHKVVSKGCPQGSVLGPCLWNLIFDELINLISTWGCEPIAYADDLVVLIQGRSRLDLQQKAQDIVIKIESWCLERRLQLSPTKTEMILLKGFLDVRRPPIIRVGGLGLKFSDKVRYLGVLFGTRLSVGPHVSFVCSKSKTLFYKLSQVARANWGIQYNELLFIYKGLFIPIITYAAAGWADRLNTQLKRKLLAVQRQVLIYVSKAYRTVSADALAIVTGSPPVDLLLSERIATYNLKKHKNINHGDLSFSFHRNVNSSQIENLYNEIKEQTKLLWQNRWNVSTKGRLTYEFMKNIPARMSASWLILNYYTVQVLTGHGNFNYKLHYFKLADSPYCRCGSLDTVQHLLFSCPVFEDVRESLRDHVRKFAQWPCELTTLLSEDNFETFSTFVNKALKRKERIVDPP